VFSADKADDELASTRERITTPYVRTQKGFEPVSMEDGLKLLCALVKKATGWRSEGSVVSFDSPEALGVKLYEYQGLENTFAATRLFFQLIGTPNVALHDRPSVASNTQGFEDTGIDPHGYAYADIWESDVLFLAGSNPYECQSVFFMNYMTGKRIIVLDPRRTLTADYAEKTGGIHLQPNVLGADVLILNALARYIRDHWPGRCPDTLIATDDQLARARAEAAKAPIEEGPDRRRRARYQMSKAEYFAFLDQKGEDGLPLYTFERVNRVCGIEIEKLEHAARILAGPEPEMKPPECRIVSLIFEKGLIWGYSYHNTAAFANLGLLLGSVLCPGDENSPAGVRIGVTGRAGGHQKGWAEIRYRLKDDDAAKPPQRGYPFHHATDEFVAEDGTRFRTHHYLDAHLVGTTFAPLHDRAYTRSAEPDIRLLWMIGCNPVGQMGDAGEKWNEVQRRRGDRYPASPAEAVEVLKKRIEAGGLVLVQQDIYPNPTTAFADLVLPAAAWGEHTTTRYSGERRLRIYSAFQDPPAHRLPDGTLERGADGKPASRCVPDWHIFRRVALDLLPAGSQPVNELDRDTLDKWTDASAVFRDMALHSHRGGLLGALEDPAQPARGHALLSAHGTKGYIIPVMRNPASPDSAPKFLESPRAPVKGFKFADGTPYGPYAFVRADWFEIADDFEANRPKSELGELAICNGRVSELWNSMFTHIRNETVRQHYPDDLPGTMLEIHAKDAERAGVSNGEIVEVSCRDIHLGAASGDFTAMLSVVDAEEASLPPGMVFAIFSYPAMKARLTEFPYRDFTTAAYVNRITTGYVDPINPIAAVKYARGTIRKTGRMYTPTEDFAGPSFARRNRSFVTAQVSSEKDRARWKLRELIVQKGLVRARLDDHAGVSDEFEDPDRFLDRLIRNAKALQGRFCGALEFMSKSWTTGAVQWTEEWNDKERALAKALLNTCLGGT